MIGIFDSGFGGLTVFREIYKLFPEYDYLYLGDNARAPYGNHSHELIYLYTQQAVEYLFKNGCELIILACNTATAAALRQIQQQYLLKNYADGRVLGVIRPVVEKAVKVTKNGRIGVVGTRLTVDSGAFQKELQNQFDEQKIKTSQPVQIFQQACPLLVPLVEEGWINKSETKKILRYYLRPLKDKKIDVLILGCTHYPLLLSSIKAIMGKKTLVLNPGEIVVDSLRDYFKRHPELAQRLSKRGIMKCPTTDEVEKFEKLGSKFLGRAIKASKVVL